ncbi:MAG TPA: carbohydrate binding family 9 domain-containing protein, partial [Vicinamibacterales bacterium]|nr:carbohydrate binding family 9 domain-containing protein [Vicinamibacterales bacterium]
MLRISLLSLLLVASVDAAPKSAATIAAAPIPSTTAIKLDGEFNETVWERVPAVSDFKQREPKDGDAATFATEVKVAYDAAHIYVAVFARDPEPSRIIGMRTRRDSDSPSDWIRVFIDSFCDRRSAFEFGVNPAGVKRDVAWSNDSSEDPGWDAVWDVSVSQSTDGWRAEFRIPFSQLRYRRSENATFGFAVARQIGRLNETDTWPLLSKAASGVVSS